MSNKITFYYNPMSRGRIVHWMLEEVGADYEIKLLVWAKGEHKSPEYLKINPMGKIPAIVHNSVVVTETAAICMYLADAFPKAGLAPAVTDPQRGTYLRWFFFAASCIEPALLDKTNPRVEPVKPSHLGYGSYQDVISTLEKVVASGYVLGDRFSAVDIYLSSSLQWGLMSKSIDANPIFQNYIDKCNQRPAFKKFTEKAGLLG